MVIGVGLAADFDFRVVFEHWQFLLNGVVVTVEVTACGMFVATVLGLLLAIGRTYGGSRVDRVIAVPVDILRAIPLLALMVWVFYALPVLVNQELTPFGAGVISLGLQYGAYMSELFRAGLGALSPGQRLAATALGMTQLQALRRIVVPQAAILMLPPAGSQFVALIKDSSLLYGIGVTELMQHGATLNGLYFRPFEIFTAIGVIYFLLTYPTTIAVNWAYKRLLPLASG
jgi:polar amino acid transport system permease protein